jgi:transposase
LKELFTMTEKELTGYNLITQVIQKKLSQMKASELLGITDRHFRRLLKAYKNEGLTALISRRRGKPSNNKIPEEICSKVIKILKGRYKGFGPTFASEKLKEEYNISLSAETMRQLMIKEGLWVSRGKKQPKLHQSRNRRDRKGELIQMDGSPHKWFGEDNDPCCLLAFIDDATSEIMHLKFVRSESTLTYFHSMREYFQQHGYPECFYSDRFSVFRINNHKEGYRGLGITQLGRALKELEIDLICANSPQAKGRVERLFSTLQDRLVKELHLAGITDIESANKYLPQFIKKHNAKYAVPAKKEENVHKTILSEKQIDGALCFKEERKLTKNLELSFAGQIIQIQTERPTYAMRGARVSIIENLKGEIKIEYKGKELSYKILRMKDHQGRIVARKTTLVGKRAI